MCNSKTIVKTYSVPRPTRVVTPSKPPAQKPTPVSIPVSIPNKPVSVPR